MKSYSKEQQDLFAYYLIGEKGTFLDLGCCHPIRDNNSVGLERIGWTGLCVDRKDKLHISGKNINLPDTFKRERRTPFLCININDDNFIKEVDKFYTSSKHIDYISLDVNGNSFICLEKLLTTGYSFSCMTFEHDDYRQKGRLKIPSKKLLEKYNYEILFEDVTTNNATIENAAWEDWWINPKSFDNKILSLKDKNLKYSQCIDLLKEYNNEKGI